MSTSTERMRALRARRAEAAGDAPRQLHDADQLLLPAVHETLEALQLGPEFAGAAEMARHFARAIDGALDAGPRAYASALRWLGPELQKTLEALGATPAARARMKPAGKAPPARASQLDRLRTDHAKRTRGRTG